MEDFGFLFWLWCVCFLVLVWGCVCVPFRDRLRRRVSRSWILRAHQSFLAANAGVAVGFSLPQYLCASFALTRPSRFICFVLWGCSRKVVLQDVVGFAYSRLYQELGSHGSYGMLSLSSDVVIFRRWWSFTTISDAIRVREHALRLLLLHCDGGFKHGSGLD